MSDIKLDASLNTFEAIRSITEERWEALTLEDCRFSADSWGIQLGCFRSSFL